MYCTSHCIWTGGAKDLREDMHGVQYHDLARKMDIYHLDLQVETIVSLAQDLGMNTH